MKLVIVGGHLSPALAILEALPKDANVLFIGRKYVFEGDKTLSLEYRTITKQKIPFASIYAGRWQRKFTKHTIPSLFKFPFGIIQSYLILRKFKTDVVLSFGGYLSLPVGLAAFILRIPIVIHEQTLEAGAANRILSIFAKKICISWESSFKYFPSSKTILTGNPVRRFQISESQFTSLGRHSGKRSASRISNVVRDAGSTTSMTGLANIDKKLPLIYITGGSSGSHFINTLVEGCIRQLLEKFSVIHQTGDAQEYHDFDHLQKLRETLSSELKSRYTITKFVEPENVGSVLKLADLVVSRAGINTVTELIFFKKPSLLIPLPSSQKNDQLKNALYLKGLGLSEVLHQGKQDSDKFLKLVEQLFDNKDKYKAESNLGAEIHTNAAQEIIKVIGYEKRTNKN